MGDTNYFSGTVKILETPIQRVFKQKTLVTIIRVEIPQVRQNRIVSLIFWGKLASKVKKSYRANDYLLIEGYSSIKKTNSKLNKIMITVLKVYPLFLTSNRPLKKKSN